GVLRRVAISRRPGTTWLSESGRERSSKVIAPCQETVSRASSPPRAGTAGNDVWYTGPPMTGGPTGGQRTGPRGADVRQGERHQGQRAGDASDHRKAEGTPDAEAMWEDGRGGTRRALSRLQRGWGGADDLYGQRREGELYGGHRSR